MDNPDPRTNLTVPGHENHGSGFLCHKCGWAYPNSHPSAKHRRSHKKICGTIEGYKSTIDLLEKTPNLTVSDNDEDDLNTPSPKLVKNVSSEAGSGSFGALSNRSEYEVFSDAVAEFSDAGPSPGIEDDSMVDTRESVSNTEKVAGDEPSNTKLLDKEISAKEDVTASPSRSIESKEVLKEDEKYLDTKIKFSPSDVLVETIDGESKLEENINNLENEPVVTLEEEKSDSSRHTIPESDVSPEAESGTLGDTTQIEANSADALNFTNADTTESSEANEEENNSRHFVIFPDSIPVVNHPEIMLEGYKDQNAFKSNQDNTLDSLEPVKNKEDDDTHVSEVNSISESTHLTKSADVTFLAAHVVEGVTDKKNTDEMLLSDKLVVPADEVRPEIEKSETVSSPLKQVSQDSGNDSSKMVLHEHVTSITSDTDSLFSLTEVDISQIVNLLSGDDPDGHEKAVKETCEIEDYDCKEEAKEERETNIPGSENDPCAIISDIKEVDNPDDHDMVDDKISDTYIEFKHLDQVSDSSRVGIDATHFVETQSNPTVFQDEDSQKSGDEPEINNNKVVELLERTDENKIMKESLASPVEALEATSVENSDIALTGVTGECVSSFVSESMPEQQGDKSISSRQQQGCVSIDSLSQTDSLEGNWGSVSDAAGKDNTREGHHHSDKPEISEPPSFMTLVEQPRVHADDSKNTDLEIQNSQKSNAGWFPSITNVVNDSQGRKKNEEIIAKVKNWTAETQQHTPLKSLLGDSNTETKQKDSNVSVVTTVNSILGSEPPVDKDSKVGTGQELNSPAKYSPEVKREKRKVKGKPYWAPFICCSSAVN